MVIKNCPPAWKILATQKIAGYEATLEPVQSYRVVDADEELIKRVKEVELDLLEKLQRVCRKNNLKVFAIYGTLLGTVRHGGMIPGDDDIDVALLRDDYDKLLSLKNEFSGKYFLQTPENDLSFSGGYSKLRNIETTAIKPVNWYTDCCEGIGIDIFPIDYCSRSRKIEKKRQKKIRFYQRMLYAYSYGFYKDFMDMKIFKWKMYKYLGKFISRKKIVEKFNSVLRNGNADSGLCCCYTHYTPKAFKEGLKREYFEVFISTPFENQEILIPTYFDEILKYKYGRYLDYSVYPVIKKYRHAFYVPDIPYTFYKPRFRYCCRLVPKNKKLVLIGDNVMLAEFYKRWGTKYIPDFFIEVEKIKWEVPKPLEYILRITFEEFIKYDKNNYYIVVCSIHYRETEKILKDYGFFDYHFFVLKREWIMLSNPDAIMIEGSK